MKRTAGAVAVAVLTLIASGCSSEKAAPKSDNAQIAGTYACGPDPLPAGFVPDTIELRADGTMKQTGQPRGGSGIVTEQGTWSVSGDQVTWTTPSGSSTFRIEGDRLVFTAGSERSACTKK